MNRLSGGGTLLLALAAGCGWFDDGRVCKEGTLSCHGDEVRVCIPKLDERAGPNGPQTGWETIETCEDDPRVGPRTCALVADRASCVHEAKDGGVVPEGREESADYLRVDVSAGGDIAAVQSQTLVGAPMSAVSGKFAVAAYRDEKPVDAVLAQFEAEATDTTVWIRADGATSVAVVDTSGRKVAERVLQAASTSEGLSVRQALLSAELPPTLRVVTPNMNRLPPIDWVNALILAREPTAEMLALVGPSLLQVSPVGLSGLREIAFADLVLRRLVDAGGSDAAGELDDSGVPEAAVESEAVGALPDRARAALKGKTLWVDVTVERLSEYRVSEAARHELALELVRLAGRAFFMIASYKVDEVAPILLPSDFPADLAALLRERISPMLEVGESFGDAWGNLHAIGVYMGVSKGYGGKYTDREAVDVGFAAARGVASPEHDFAEYLARTTVVDGWPEGPCEELQGQKLEDLAPRRFANIAKLEVLRGLGVVAGERVVACTGELASKMTTPAIVMHKASGEQVWFEQDPTGARAEWNNTVSVLATAGRDAIQALVNVQYRAGALPSVIRLGKVTNPLALPQSATFGLTNPMQRENAGAEGGLVVIDRVTRDAIEAHLLMVQIAKPRLTIDDFIAHPEWVDGPFGAWWFPLVTIRVSTFGWQDGSFDADL